MIKIHREVVLRLGCDLHSQARRDVLLHLLGRFDVETYGLYDAMQQLSENTWHMWRALSTAQQLGNAGAHARADPLSAH